MAIIQCENKHYYDNSKFDKCPHCERMRNGDLASSLDNKTVAKYNSGGSSQYPQALTKSLRDSVKDTDDAQKTIGIFTTAKNINPVAGWLVCIQGENRGRSFEIHIGKNFAGRSMKMDIHHNDPQISRENHYTIVFDPKSRQFFIMQGNGITYFNDEMLVDTKLLTEGDTIGAGSSKYVFVPFCKEGRDWDD